MIEPRPHDERQLADLLREVDRNTPRPLGAPMSIARLHALERRHRMRQGIIVALLLLLPALTMPWWKPAPQKPAPRTCAPVIAAAARWLHDVRQRRAEQRVRELVSTQRAEQALARTATVAAVYAGDLLAQGDARAPDMLRRVATDFANTSGGRHAARTLASLSVGETR